jgi:hypothetical protein
MPKNQAVQAGVLILVCSFMLGLLSGCQSTTYRGENPPDNGNTLVGHVLAVFDEEGDPYEIIVYRNGNALATTPKTSHGVYGVLGTWSATPDTLIISYDDGSREVFVDFDGTIRRQEYYPRRKITTTANRYEYGWKVKGNRAWYVGAWYCHQPLETVKKGQKPAQYLMLLGSDGKASRTDNTEITGAWSVNRDGSAEVIWSDGARDIIIPTGDGYEMRTLLKDMKPDQQGLRSVPVRRGA